MLSLPNNDVCLSRHCYWGRLEPPDVRFTQEAHLSQGAFAPASASTTFAVDSVDDGSSNGEGSAEPGGTDENDDPTDSSIENTISVQRFFVDDMTKSIYHTP